MGCCEKTPPTGEYEAVSLRARVPGPLCVGRREETKGDTLLKLRKVEITGFKSFCERTIVTFSGTGTTCIVGPNGCGKSNVVDAISWVLGEQSHKSLRAGRMSDCIFNGTVKRPPMGLAEVTITMEDPELAEAARFVMESAEQSEGINAASLETTELSLAPNEEIISLTDAPVDGTVPEVEVVAAEVSDGPAFLKGKRKKKAEKPELVTKPGEVVVSRRLYRSGQSEYLINGRVARLRDIQEMFMGVGLGPDSYAIIEQGRIGQILSTKPMERRAIIEEAAGVTKFKTKKRLAEAKLESSKLNLARVNDIVVEVSGRRPRHGDIRKFASRCAGSCDRCWRAKREKWKARLRGLRRRSKSLRRRNCSMRRRFSSKKASRTG